MKRVCLAVFLVCVPGLAFAETTDDDVALARSCFDSAGGPSSCQNVFGWCDPVWGYDRRQHCSEGIAARWEKVLKSYWGELQPVVEAYDAANNRDNDPPIWQAMQLEQRAWRVFRDASCAMDLTAEGVVTGPEEERADCEANLTRLRVGDIYQRLLWMRGYVDDYR